MASNPAPVKHKKVLQHRFSIHRTTTSLSKELATLRMLQTEESTKLRNRILEQTNAVATLMAKVESKETITRFRGTSAPTELRMVHPGFELTETKESALLVNTLRSLFTDKHYRFRLSTALNISSSAGGAINSTLSCSVLTSQADFGSLSSVFNEFFVIGFDAHFMPNSRYNILNTGAVGTGASSLPIGVGDLQHGQAAYTNLTAMSDNFRFAYHTTSDPFHTTWINTEKVSETVVASQTAPTQSWCPVSNVSNYQGTLQFISQAAPPGLPASQIVGTFITHFDVLFRVRA